MKTTLSVLGLMSGSSLDGLDLTLCTLEEAEEGWRYRFEATDTVDFPPVLYETIRSLTRDPSGSTLARGDMELGQWMGGQAHHFLYSRDYTPDLIASHGHTVFHRPDEGYTFQAGNGEILAYYAGFPVVTDFRSKDVAKGGQGAPLVPIGDELLFGDHAACLNLGGIANISTRGPKGRMGWDVCPCNLLLNELASQKGTPFDRDGAMARKGTFFPALFEKLEALPFFHQEPPKALGREWYESHVAPLIRDPTSQLTTEDRLRTATEHIGKRIGEALDRAPAGKVLVTGGGCRNEHLVERIRAYSNRPLSLPKDPLIDHKEGLVFALLGALRWKGKVNVLGTATGAFEDSVAGSVHLP